MRIQVSGIKYQVSSIKYLYFVLFALCFLLFVSCHKEAPVPAYISIDTFTLTTNYSTEGSNAHKIVDAWIDVDGQSLGAFEMPCTVPALFSGPHTITVWPGVKENGISTTRIHYPFYNTYAISTTLTQGNILKINPTTSYTSYSKFPYIQDFEGGTGMLDTTGTDTSMQIVHYPNPAVFEGNGSGMVVLTGNKSTYYGVTNSKFALPNTPSIFLEMNYNCNTEFHVGVVAYDASSNYLGEMIALNLRPTTTGWNKVYVNLNDAVISFSAVKYAIFFSMQKTSDPSYFYLDNVKLITHN